jgi:hypothetical protein
MACVLAVLSTTADAAPWWLTEWCWDGTPEAIYYDIHYALDPRFPEGDFYTRVVSVAAFDNGEGRVCDEGAAPRWRAHDLIFYKVEAIHNWYIPTECDCSFCCPPECDFEGRCRPIGAGWDIGAYEYVPAQPKNLMREPR